MFCQACQKILRLLAERIHKPFHRGFGSKGMADHQQTYLDLQNAAKAGCYLCANLWKYASAADQCLLLEASDYRRATAFHIMTNFRPLQIILRFEIPENLREALQFQQRIVFVIKQSQEIESLGPTKNLEDSTCSKQSRNQVEKWLKTCILEHQTCHKLRKSSGWHPTRMLDVGFHGETIRLIETASEQTITIPYLTLSHCWGSIQPLRLTRSTLAKFKENIDWSTLPPTFKDAISFTRSLKIRYLWIDSLCIIQDEDYLDDWHQEASLMHEVYSNSLLNLAADSAHDSSGGLFHNRNPRLVQTCSIDLPSSQPGETDKYLMYDTSIWHSQVHSSPLSKRAWYFQERMLAPRILHFTTDQLFWECSEMCAAENFPHGFDPVMSVDHFKSIDPRDSTVEHILESSWPRIVQEYSRASLTKPGDKLIALSGVAKKMQAKIGGRYIAGLWEEDLIHHLCWYVLRDAGLATQPSSYRAPSFSWACLDREVSMKNLRQDVTTPHVNFIQTNISPVTEDRHGAVDDAFIILDCQLHRTRLEKTPKGGWKIVFSSLGFGIQELDVVVYVDAPRDLYGRTYATALATVSATVSGEETNNMNVTCGLVLEPCRSQGTFQRLGLFQVRSRDAGSFEEIISPSGDADGLPCEHYDSVTKRHVIRII